MFCSWVDYGTEEQCGERAELFANLPLCAEHADVYRSRNVSYSTISQCLNYYRLEDFPGLCYIVLLPDGSVKIGYSNTNELLDKRLKSLGREYGAPVIQLAVLPGGFVAEAFLHRKFAAYREPGKGERFRYSPEMAEFLASVS